jgi:hypothetical protein
VRKVKYFEYEKLGEDTFYTRVERGEAVFHTFGIDCQEFEHGVGTFTTAIIELEDGSMKNLLVEQVQFIN